MIYVSEPEMYGFCNAVKSFIVFRNVIVKVFKMGMTVTIGRSAWKLPVREILEVKTETEKFEMEANR